MGRTTSWAGQMNNQSGSHWLTGQGNNVHLSSPTKFWAYRSYTVINILSPKVATDLGQPWPNPFPVHQGARSRHCLWAGSGLFCNMIVKWTGLGHFMPQHIRPKGPLQLCKWVGPGLNFLACWLDLDLYVRPDNQLCSAWTRFGPSQPDPRTSLLII